VPLPKEVVEECVKNRSVASISQLINSWQNNNARQLMSTDFRKGSGGKLSALEPLLTFQILMSNSAPSSFPTIPMLTLMIQA